MKRGGGDFTRVLFDNARLDLVEALARRISPPLLEFPVLVVQTTGRVERVLRGSVSRTSTLV